MQAVSRAAGRPAAYFVFVVFIVAKFRMAKLEFFAGGILQNLTMNSECRACRIVGFRIAGTRYRQFDGNVHRIHTHSVHDVHTVCSQARTDINACLSLKSWTAQDVWVVSSLCAWKNPSPGQPCHPLAGLFHIFSLLVYHNTKHNLDSTIFKDDTVHRAPLQEPLPPLPETTQSESNTRSESSAEKSLSHIKYESARNLLPNTSTINARLLCDGKSICADMARVKEIGRYLAGKPRTVCFFRRQKKSELEAYADADRVGDRTSVHCLKGVEQEAASGVIVHCWEWQSRPHQKDWRFRACMQTESHLWIQEASKSEKFLTKNVGTHVNPAHHMTKPLPRPTLEQPMNIMSYRFVK